MIINGRYHLVRALKGSSPHRAFLAEDIQEPEGSYLVVKQISLPRTDPQADQFLRQLFFERADTLQSLADQDSQFPEIVDYFEEGGRLHLVREWIDGATLMVRVQKGGRIEQEEVERILGSALESLSALHEAGIAHGNLKPSNIILAAETGAVILTDFNLIPISAEVVTAAASATPAPALNGTGLGGFEPLNQRALAANDVHSLGLIAIYLLTGQLPHQLAADPHSGRILWRQGMVDVDPDLADVLDRATHPHPDYRYATATAMLDDLQEVVPPTVLQSSSGIGLARWMLTIRRGIVIGAIAALLVLGYGAVKRLLQPLTSSVAESSPATSPGDESPATPPTTAASMPPTASPATSVQPLTQEQATALVSRWLTAKQRIFSPPYDRTLAESLTTNPLLNDILKPGGSVAWLSQNNARYQFSGSRINAVQQFQSNGPQASLDAVVAETRTLYVGDRIDASQSGSDTLLVRYDLRWSEGQWKIADYRNVR